jgi:hypothetical protein
VTHRNSAAIPSRIANGLNDSEKPKRTRTGIAAVLSKIPLFILCENS